MDWYFDGANDDDLIVPNDQDLSETPWSDECIPLDNWFHGGTDTCEEIGVPKKIDHRSIKPIGRELCLDDGISYLKVEPEPSICGDDLKLNECEGLLLDDQIDREALLSMYRFLNGWPDSQLHESMELMDDPFMTPLLGEDLSDVEIPRQSLCFGPDYASNSFDNLSSEILKDPHSSMKYDSHIGASGYPKKQDVPLPTNEAVEDEEVPEVSLPPYLQSDDTSKSKGPEIINQDPYFSELVPDEPSATSDTLATGCRELFERTVLQEFEDVMTQFTLNTRICFRDALYRLAKCSKVQHFINQNESMTSSIRESGIPVADDGGLSFWRLELPESKTNIIDRTITDLIFDGHNCGLSNVPVHKM